MRLTIERLRTLVLLAGGLLVAGLVVFLVHGHWRNRFSLRDIPKRLGANIERQQNGVVYTQSSHGHMVFKLTASKVVQLKKDGRALLNDVEIELYGKDGETVDRIRGQQFEWDTSAKKATAAGPVEILIMRPMATPAVAEGVRGAKPAKPKAAPAPLSNPARAAAQSVAEGQIDVKTSGLIFDSESGAAATAARVEFSTAQGSGSSEGATFDSGNGTLVLDRAVELNVRRGDKNVLIHAQHAEFDRDQRICTMSGADAQYRGGEAKAGQAQVLFREDGSAVRLDAHDGFALTTATGARIASPMGSLDFNEQNQPQQGRLQGGVTLASSGGGREASGSAPEAVLSFSSRGELRHAHLERGVILDSAEDGSGGVRVTRDWRSPVADVEFRTTAQGQTQIAQVHGTGGVIITGLTQRAGAPAAPSRMAADDVTGVFGPGQQLAELIGVGQASLEQTAAASGAQQTTSGDRIDARFAPAGEGRQQGSQQIQSALIDGNVVMTDQEPAKPGEAAPALTRATAGHAVFDGAGQWLHLTASPWIESGGLELTADKVDVSQASGDAFAHGNVKATWMDSGKPGAGQGGMGLGGDGPAHVIAAEAEMHRAADEATFRGKARLWQGANSVSAPVIVLNRTRQTLTAHGSGAAQPVNLVLLTAGGPGDKQASSRRQAGSQVVSVRAGNFKYSAAERRAVVEADGSGNVVAQSQSATVTAREAQLTLLPPGNHAGSDGHAGQVDRMTARGHVVIVSNDRHGTGEMLVYTSDTGKYVLTGTADTPPRLTDPVHGTVTGNALIFNTRDDSVSIEGRGQKTSTETMAPK